MKKHITIGRKNEQDDLFTRLQEESIKEVQRLSGEVWTDYNDHDPGVTVLETLNYSLLELDYRLQFNIEDYLTQANQEFNPVNNSLFLPEDVFTVNPVTALDYRKLFISTIEELTNIWVIPRLETGIYDFLLEVVPEITEQRKEKIVDEIVILYHNHRNLCETLGNIRFVEQKTVSLQAVIDAGDVEDVNALLVRIYMEIQEFLSSGVRFCNLNDLLEAGHPLEDILDGPRQKRMVIDETSLHEQKKEYNFLKLHRTLRELKGVYGISSLSLWVGDVNLDTFLKAEHQQGNQFSYVITPPADEVQQQKVVIQRRGKVLSVDWTKVQRMYHLSRLRLYGDQNHTTNKQSLNQFPTGTYRDIFQHLPVKNDLPSCYWVAEQLHQYLDMFDGLITDTLSDLKNIPLLLRTDTNNLSEEKELWLNMLDSLYGENSNPVFLKETEGVRENRIRRSHFLSSASQWGYERGKACNILDYSEESISGLEHYFKHIMPFEKHELEIFLLEHILFQEKSDDAFTISIVLSAHDNCMDDDEFKMNCEQLLLSRVPAHICTNIYWLNKNKVRLFKKSYTFWRYLLSTKDKIGLIELSEKMKDSLENDRY